MEKKEEIKEKLSVRRIREDDRADYLALARDFYHTDAVMAPIPEEHFDRCFTEMLRSDVYAAAWMFTVDGVSAGYAQIARTYSQEAGGMVIWIEDLYVKPEYRGMGIGSALFDLLEREYPDTARYRLEVEEENEGAVRLYRRRGYSFMPYGQMYREMKQK